MPQMNGVLESKNCARYIAIYDEFLEITSIPMRIYN